MYFPLMEHKQLGNSFLGNGYWHKISIICHNPIFWWLGTNLLTSEGQGVPSKLLFIIILFTFFIQFYSIHTLKMLWGKSFPECHTFYFLRYVGKTVSYFFLPRDDGRTVFAWVSSPEYSPQRFLGKSLSLFLSSRMLGGQSPTVIHPTNLGRTMSPWVFQDISPQRW